MSRSRHGFERSANGYQGGYDRVQEVVRERGRRLKEAFVPLAHPRGPHAALPHGVAARSRAGRFGQGACHHRRRASHGALLLHGSSAFGFLFREGLQRGARTGGALALKPAETTEAFLDGHVSAFAYFGGVPRSILYDNTKVAVARITGAGERMPTIAFTGLKSHFLFETRFGRHGKGNDKGKVEGLVKYAFSP